MINTAEVSGMRQKDPGTPLQFPWRPRTGFLQQDLTAQMAGDLPACGQVNDAEHQSEVPKKTRRGSPFLSDPRL